MSAEHRAAEAARYLRDHGSLSGATMEASSMQVQTEEILTAAAPSTPDLSAQSRGFVAEWTVTILIMLFASTTLAWSYVIPTGSMEDTLLVGDHIVVDKLAYAPVGPISKYFLPYEEPKRGDIIAFQYPADTSQMFVKRVVGVPGDRLKIADQEVFVNGEKLKEPYAYHKSSYFDPYRDNFPADISKLDITPDAKRDSLLRDMLKHHVVNGEVVVPPNSYFAMGDNRDNSLDSRYWGFVPRDYIVGKPVFIYWSYNTSTDMLMPQNAKGYETHVLDIVQHLFVKTRWNRTFRLIHGYHFSN
jgi:signal peptidase I